MAPVPPPGALDEQDWFVWMDKDDQDSAYEWLGNVVDYVAALFVEQHPSYQEERSFLAGRVRSWGYRLTLDGRCERVREAESVAREHTKALGLHFRSGVEKSMWVKRLAIGELLKDHKETT